MTKLGKDAWSNTEFVLHMDEGRIRKCVIKDGGKISGRGFVYGRVAILTDMRPLRVAAIIAFLNIEKPFERVFEWNDLDVVKTHLMWRLIEEADVINDDLLKVWQNTTGQIREGRRIPKCHAPVAQKIRYMMPMSEAVCAQRQVFVDLYVQFLKQTIT